MTKDEYEDFVLRYKGCGACFPMYHTLNQFEKKWFTAIQKDVTELEKYIEELKEDNEELEKENAELKEQVNEWLNAYSDTSLVKVLRDCIYKNEKLSSQEQQQLSAWVECAMDFGSIIDGYADQLIKAKEIIRNILQTLKNEGSDYTFALKNTHFVLLEAEQFLKEK